MTLDVIDEWLLSERYYQHPDHSQSRIDDIVAMVKKQQACFWVAEEIDLYQDLADWEGLKDDERHFISYVLAFFAASDGIVLENLAGRFLREIHIPEVRSFYSFQIAMENVHSETYSLLIDVYLKGNEAEKSRLFNAIQSVEAVKRKAEWAVKWMNHKNTFAERLLGFCAVEGILFSGSFCAIFWFKKRGLLPGLTFSNELISRDEGLHTDFGALLYTQLGPQRLSQSRAHNIIDEALQVEKYFILQALPVDLIGMNGVLMAQYLEYVADRLLQCLGYGKLYNTTNPFDWMEMISVQGKTNFFEKRVGDYQQPGTLANKEEQNFSLDTDF
ncbi:ribonucleoside-diphosphate reductase small subunit [Gregarina niphandrodes]|uniref:Ribonucleoside-diphosphate reductase small subunit n=1 Tax=Gregarina niphandrodes TaxID=110365 RepID=A0A023B3H5_GRENI|nr:ribonucleoside-diphosphate reductase small subunit [Gregarina niphandrodes]EZG55337.1 ribonucleoside-diphosphate reductase small subunit [Gregarina niphandrodes]|eukprot:XP_011131632.1 ribonucleoside-diphosphate reductase small subunit [Gregarina niphandrodes]